MSKMKGTYLGNKKLELVHEESGTKIFTAAPRDNNGDGSSFSPTDLVSSALGACMFTVMGIFAERNNIELKGGYFTVEKIMTDGPRRISELRLVIHLPSSLPQESRIKFERVALTCPVHHSLREDIKANPQFLYDV